MATPAAPSLLKAAQSARKDSPAVRRHSSHSINNASSGAGRGLEGRLSRLTASGASARQSSIGGDDETNPWRDEIVQTIFGEVGTIISDFSCAIERHILLHGRMYVTDRFICFYSNRK